MSKRKNIKAEDVGETFTEKQAVLRGMKAAANSETGTYIGMDKKESGKDKEKRANAAKDALDQNAFLYSGRGKRVRGALCMLTFLIFMLFLGLVVFSIMQYGLRIITDRRYDFYDSYDFKNQLRYEAEEVLDYAYNLDVNRGPHSFNVIDVEKCVVNSYDLDSMVNEDVEYMDNLEMAKKYINGTTKLTDNFYNYEYAARIIKNMEDDSYLYFSQDAFIRIFSQNGLVNTGHRFSDAFSAASYFIYMDPDIMALLKEAEEAEMTSATELEMNIDILMENTAYILEQKSINLDECEYAVYDPKNQVFYSSWDDYFTESAYYIYNADEVASRIESHELTEEYVSSIIFPLLWSENYSDLWSLVMESYVYTEPFERYLREKENSAFLYYIEMKNGNVYANIGSAADVAYMDVSYLIGGGIDAPEPNRSVNELFQAEELLEHLTDYGGSGMYFGLNPVHIQLEDESPVAQLAWGYEKVARYVVWWSLLAVIFLAALLWQAVLLIRTTGRKSRESSTILLTRFDKLYTELWFIICIVLLSAAGTFAVVGPELFGSYTAGYFVGRSSAYQIYQVVLQVVYSLPLGYCLMVLSLSLARRVKAHNFRKRLYIRKLVREGVVWVNRKKSSDRLKMITITYICVQVVILLVSGLLIYLRLGGYMEFLGIRQIVFLMILSFAVTWGLMAYFMRHVIADIRAIKEGVARITKGDFETKVALSGKITLFSELADGINHIGDGLKRAVDTSLKDERMKTELITNVSHDLKTPLTSIINYINLLKRESMPTPAAKHYVEVLDAKAHRLSQLTEDLVEAAKATSGNIELDMMPISFDELMKQALGEFEDKFAEKQLTVVAAYPKTPAVVLADGRRLFRILDNVLQNAYKYAMERTRIYVELGKADGMVCFTMKNISAAQLNISAEELMERFTRGDSSRTTEGSGLGLSIAKDLTRLMEGSFELELDGDLFKVMLTFPEYQREEEPAEQKPSVQESVVQKTEDAGAEQVPQVPGDEMPEASNDVVGVPTLGMPEASIDVAELPAH